MDSYLASIERHYSTFWSPPIAARRWPVGPIETVRPEFRVLEIQRSPSTIAFATLGMSALEDAIRLELYVLVRLQDRSAARESVVELLAAVAHYHRTAHLLDLGHTVNFGRGWVDQSACSYGLISLPYLDGPELEWMKDPPVRFLWLIPITPAEREFKKSHGLEMLEQRFEQAQVDLLDPLRPDTVQQPV